MRSVICSKFCITVFTIGSLLINISNSIDIVNYQEVPDLIYLINGSYKQDSLHRHTRQNTPTCRIPSNPPDTIYNVIGETLAHLSAGDEVQNFNILQITCNRGFSINPIAQNHSICIDGKWTPPLTNCLRTCPSLNSITSTNIKCKWNDHTGNQIPLPNCVRPVEGTTAFLSCNSWYEEPNIKKNPIRVCKQGRWDPYITECYPICGVKRPKGVTNVINGTIADLRDYPWQIGIYNAQKEFLCGGSILDYNIILSAAHCFTDHDGNKNPTENYLIAAGKYYREYDDERDKFAQYSKINKIQVPSRYKGITNLQGFDIAVVILTTPLKITPAVQPICIELDEQSKSFNLSAHKYGVVTGWGFTESGRELSEVLKEVVIPYIPYQECFQMVPLNFRRYITHDKICGGTGVCGGDSGGGYIFKKMYSDRHFVKGIVSVSPATIEGVCDPNQYGVYTSVDEHIDFIRLHLTYNQIYQSLECTQDDCIEELQNGEECSSNDYACRNAKIRCALPNLALNGTYSLNKDQTYTPGGYAKINSVLTMKCHTGFLSNLDKPVQFHCSDKGEWTPPLRSCADKLGYCSYGPLYIKHGERVSTPVGSCGAVVCLDATNNGLASLTCESTKTCPFEPFDYTKVFPSCCPNNDC